MSDANAIAEMGVRVCIGCGESKPLASFKKRYGIGRRADARITRCNPCIAQYRRDWYARSPEARRKAVANAARNGKEWRARNRERWNEYKRRARRRKAEQEGRPLRARLTNEQRHERHAVEEGRKAWRHWLTIAPDWWMAAYYEAAGNPWKNPRLSGAERYRLRYARDPAFYEREYARLQRKKVRHRTAFADGTATAEEIARLRLLNDCCAYCGVFLTLRKRHIDHATPLARSGKHEIGNLVVCCLSCNSRKHTRTAEEYREKFKVLPEGSDTGLSKSIFQTCPA